MKNHHVKHALFCVFGLFPILLFSQITGVRFSEPSGVKTSSFSLSLSTDDPSREIYYTTDGSEPTTASTKYSNPISINQNTLVLARSFLNGNADESVSRVGYAFLSNEVKNFTSSLPVLIVDNLGQGNLPAPSGGGMGGGPAEETPHPNEGTEIEGKHFSISSLYEPNGGNTSLDGEPSLSYNSGIKVRGSSSASFPKKSYGYDSWNSLCEEDAIKPLGLAKSADWVLHGSRNQDPTYIRSIVPYELSRQMGQWAPGSSAVEVFLNIDGGDVTMDDYIGIYFFMEKIGRGKDKLDIEKLDPETQPSDPEITGGYIIKIDRADENVETFTSTYIGRTGTAVANYYYPKGKNIPQHQEGWIKDYFGQIDNAIANIPNSKEYTELLDVPSIIDHWILKAMPKDADGLVLSEFFHKYRDGKLKAGPIWDLDRSAGSIDSRSAVPENWNVGEVMVMEFNGMKFEMPGDVLAGDYWTYGWYGKLHEDPDYKIALYDRWYELRQGALKTSNINRVIDSLAQVMAPAMQRDIQLWPIDAYGGTFQGAINAYKEWLEKRCVWIDGQFGGTPQFFSQGSEILGSIKSIDANNSISIQSQQQGTIYYTTDGSDPRLQGGAVNSNAQQYNSSISISNTSTILARTYNNGEWSAMRKVTFYIHQDYTNIKITEVHYNPADEDIFDGSDLEFIELKNTGSTPIILTGVYFSDGIEFSFPEGSTIGGGEFIVIAYDPEVFSSATGNTADYKYLSKLSNSGEHIALADPFGDIITEVEYSDTEPWPEKADGMGYSLVPTNINPTGNQNDVSKWRTSTLIGGSPGADDELIEFDPIIITEVLANSSDPYVDMIEIYNPNNKSVNIEGWLLNDKLSDDDAWTIPNGTTIEANSYMVFHEGDYSSNGNVISDAEDFGSAFSIGSDGDEVYILSASNGTLIGYSNGFELEPTLENISYGEYTNSIGDKDIVALKEQTFGDENSAPKVGPVVITQIMHTPETSGFEFIQIKNISAETVKLYDENHPENTWKVNGLSFNFDQGTELTSGEAIYLIANDASESSFRSTYSIPQTIDIYSFSGSIDNSGETLSIQLPLEPEDDNGEIKIPYATVDKVSFETEAPWPDANANGKLLQRKDIMAYGNDPINWIATEDIGSFETTYALSVKGGTGSGSYKEGESVSIIAEDSEIYNQLFYKWSGSGVEYVDDPFSSETFLTMPNKNIELLVEYQVPIDAQVIDLRKGWNMVTLYVEPTDAIINELFPNAQIIKNDNAFYMNSNSDFLNSLTELHAGDAFLIYNSVDEEIYIEGVFFFENYSYSLSKGWNLAGIPRNHSIHTDDISQDISQIKDLDNFFDRSNSLGKLTEMQGGKAYFMYVNKTIDFTFEDE